MNLNLGPKTKIRSLGSRYCEDSSVTEDFVTGQKFRGILSQPAEVFFTAPHTMHLKLFDFIADKALNRNFKASHIEN